MDDLISRDALKEALAKRVPYAVVTSDDAAFAYGLDAAYVAVQSAPTIDPVRHGRWARDDTFRDLYFCDQRLAREYRKPKFKYCPDCGAKMDGAAHD